jgi:CRP-like cAMP-binding protein
VKLADVAGHVTDLLVRKLQTRDVISEEETAALAGMVNEVKKAGPGKTLVRSGAVVSECNLLVEGMVCRYKDLTDGQRQILELHVPGDFIDLHSFVLKRLEHNIGSLTPIRVAPIPHEAMKRVTESHPHLGRMLWFSTLLDASIHREWILSMGRRTALSRVAHILCELFVRMDIVGLAGDRRYPLPLTQTDIADATGLTPVHVNRMLKKLRDDNLLTFRNGEVTIHDWDGLQRTAEFNLGYLYLDRRPR